MKGIFFKYGGEVIAGVKAQPHGGIRDGTAGIQKLFGQFNFFHIDIISGSDARLELKFLFVRRDG